MLNQDYICQPNPFTFQFMKKSVFYLASLLLISAAPFMLSAQVETPDSAPDRVPTKASEFTVSGQAGVNISGPTTICKGGETILKAEGNYESFEWNTGVLDRFLKVREEGTYEVTVTTKGGCKFTTSVTVRMIPCT